jgi:hypothetical protein
MKLPAASGRGIKTDKNLIIFVGGHVISPQTPLPRAYPTASGWSIQKIIINRPDYFIILILSVFKILKTKLIQGKVLNIQNSAILLDCVIFLSFPHVNPTPIQRLPRLLAKRKTALSFPPIKKPSHPLRATWLF